VKSQKAKTILATNWSAKRKELDTVDKAKINKPKLSWYRKNVDYTKRTRRTPEQNRKKKRLTRRKSPPDRLSKHRSNPRDRPVSAPVDIPRNGTPNLGNDQGKQSMGKGGTPKISAKKKTKAHLD